MRQDDSIGADQSMSLKYLYKHISLLVRWDNVEKSYYPYKEGSVV
jgi:hypothetical protein